MPKLTLTDLGSLTNESSALAVMVANNTAIENALENTVSRDGTVPNTMAAAFDMNSNKIINLGTPSLAADAVTKAYVDNIVTGTTGILPSVTLESAGGGTSKTSAQNKAAFDAIIATGSGQQGVRIILGAGTYNTLPFVIAKQAIVIEGAGLGVTVLQFNPTADGNMIEFNAGIVSGEINDCAVMNMSLIAPDVTYKKVMVKAVSQTGLVLKNILIGDTGLGGGILNGGGTGGSVGLYVLGHQFLRLENFHCFAEQPIIYGKNPINYISTDHYDHDNLYLIGSTGKPLIQYEAGVTVYDNVFDGLSGVRGTDGIYVDPQINYNFVTAIAAAGTGYHVADIVTAAGGTGSGLKITVLGVNGSGGITNAAVNTVGAYSVLPANPVAQLSTTGTGTGATFTMGSAAGSIGLKVTNARLEQGVSGYNFNLQFPSTTPMLSVILDNVNLDAGRKGIIGRQITDLSLRDVSFTGVEALNLDSTVEAVSGSNVKIGTGSTTIFSGQNVVYSTVAPTGYAYFPNFFLSPTARGMAVSGSLTNDNAPVGTVGEFIESEVLSGAALAQTTDVVLNVTSISLTAGDWDVWGTASFAINAATTSTYYQGAISTVSATLPARPGKGGYFELRFPFTAGNSPGSVPVGTRRLSLSATTTVYLVAVSGFAVNVSTAFGYIGARRVR